MKYEITGKPLIGRSFGGSSEGAIKAVNPSDGTELGPDFEVATQSDLERACELAQQAFDSYRAAPLETRALFLERIATNISEVRAALIDRAIAETGLPEFRLQGEFDRTVRQLNIFADLVRKAEWLDLRVDTALPERKPLPRPDIRLRQIGLGPTAVFGSSNFPLAFSVAGGDTASALAAGCPVVVKGHLAHPGTAELAGRAVREAVEYCGLHEGVFSLLPGGNAIGAALVAHPAIKAVGFTGSRAGGMALGAIAAARSEPIPVYAEMSSINPTFLFPAALEARAQELANGFVGSLTVGAGQLCTNPGLIVAVSSETLELFIKQTIALVLPHEPGPMLTAGIHAAYQKGIGALSAHDAVRTLVTSQAGQGINRSPAVFFETTAAEFTANPILAEEVFGASGLLVRCRDVEEMIALSETFEGQLTATLHIDEGDYADAARLLPVLERKVGRILANGWPTGVEVSDAMVHGGPFPATSDSRSTSVGTMAIRRFLRPVSYQNMPSALLPGELKPEAVSKLPHIRDGERNHGCCTRL